MGKISALWELQTLDNKERAMRRELDNLEIRSEIKVLQRRLEKKRGDLQSISRRLKETGKEIKRGEGENASAAAQQQELEMRLYSGKTTNSKELSQIQKKITHLGEKGRELEEKILELMLEQESLEREEAALAAVVQELEEELTRKQLIFAQEAGEIEDELAVIPAARQELVGKVEERWFALYRELYKNKRGQAVAPVRGDLCLGCRISLPTNLVSQITSNERLQTCPNCGRILYYQGTK